MDPTPGSGQSTTNVGRFRWAICTLLFLGVTKNYVDRQVIGVLKHTLQHELGWSEIDYGNLVFTFQVAYGAGMLLMGRFIDWTGTRIGYAVTAALWSLAAMAHGMATSLTSFLGARFALGFGEAGVIPGSIKATAEWFPKKERALATGIFNGGTNVGAVITPLFVPWITVHWGWRWAFILIGAAGFLWIALWLLIYRRPEEHSHCSAAELAYIRSESEQARGRIPWSQAFRHRQAWAFAMGKFISDPIWWFYLFWIPDFLQRRHGLDLLHLGLPLVVIYLMADAGSIVGGWYSSWLIQHGRTVNFARKAALLACAVSAIPIMTAPRISSLWGAVLLLGLATAAHSGFSTNLLTLPSDMFPARAVGSVVGIGGMVGAVSGGLIAKVVAHFLQWTGSYTVPFMMAGTAYLLAVLVIHLLAPRLEPVR